MEIMIAHQVSYTTEYRDGRIDSHDLHTLYFVSREHAVAHATHLSHDAIEDNGVFQSEWIAPFSSFFAPEDTEEIRITATIKPVTIKP